MTDPWKRKEVIGDMKPLAIDLFCGFGGWTKGLLAEGYRVIGFDIEQYEYGDAKYPAQLVIQDVLTLHGRQFKDATLIVASPPCQEFSYMAMPWSRAKRIKQEYLEGKRDVKKLTALFDACFRIQREAIDAAGHFIPLVVENVRGAIPWIGRSRWNYGSYHLWGDVPALMPMTKSFKSQGMNWSNRTKRGQDFTRVAGRHAEQGCSLFFDEKKQVTTCFENDSHIKQGGDWFNAKQLSISRLTGSKSYARKIASAMIAKIPFPLARHIAWAWHPQRQQGISGVQ